jgi:hypothetical protein
MRELISTIEINATPEKVWQVLLEFEKYSQWNPFIKSIHGNPIVGEKIEARIHPPGQRHMNFKPIILRVDNNRELRWLGHLLFPGIFDGEHAFIIEKQENSKVIFRQEEKFSGILTPVFWKSLYQHTRIGFIEMNQALKQRVEEGSQET